VDRGDVVALQTDNRWKNLEFQDGSVDTGRCCGVQN